MAVLVSGYVCMLVCCLHVRLLACLLASWLGCLLAWSVFARLVASWGLLGAFWGLLGVSWGPLGGLLGPPGGLLGASWGLLGMCNCQQFDVEFELSLEFWRFGALKVCSC